MAEDKTTEETNVEATATDENAAAGESTENATQVDEVTATPPPVPPVSDTPTAPVKEKKVEQPYASFFNQYLDLVKAGNSAQAIKALNQCIKAMLKNGSATAFNATFKLFNDNNKTLTINNKLQSIATLSSSDRAVVEVVTTVFHVISTGKTETTDLEKVRAVVKNDAFVNWCAKKFAK